MTDEMIPEGEAPKLWDDAIENADVSGLSPDEQLALVHELTTRRLVEALRDSKTGRSYGILTAARGFLRDNEVTGLDLPGTAHAELRKAIAARAPFKLTGTDS